MKSSEFHRKIKQNGWKLLRIEGSHYLYEKDGKVEAVPFHGPKEMGEGLRKTLIKRMQLNK